MLYIASMVISIDITTIMRLDYPAS
jgi:hypothetical protein